MTTIAIGNEALADKRNATAAAYRSILVATDGTSQSEGALAVARLLAGAFAGKVEVVAVQRSIAPVVPDASMLIEPNVVAKLTAELKDRVCSQCAEASAGGSGPALPEPEVLCGDPERVVTRLATERGAHLIVVGIGRHDLVDRIFGSETALKVARISRVPVLAVPAELRTAPHRVVVGVDFSEASLHAAQSAVQLLSTGGVVHLVHVIPHERLLLDPWISDREYDDLVKHWFARFRARLVVPPDVNLEEHTCSGNAARELIGFAARNRADVVAAGSHGHGSVTRLVLGSVTTGLLRAANCAVLVVPPDRQSLEQARTALGNVTIHVDPSEWPAILADFTRTNGGRRTRLEIDDPEFGAQAQELDYPLGGVVYDPHDRRLQIMLGGLGTGEPHLSHSISGATALDLLTDRDGNDIALRVQHGAGQTLLSFLSS